MEKSRRNFREYITAAHRKFMLRVFGTADIDEIERRDNETINYEEYLDKISKIKLPNTKINKIKGMEFSERLKRVVDSYNDRSRDKAFANEVLDDVATQLADLLRQLKKEQQSFEGMGINFEEKAFYDILESVAKKYEFEYPKDKMISLAKEVKKIVDDKAKYTDWSTRDDIKAELQADLAIILDANGYPPVAIDEAYKEVLEQAENFRKYAG